jgi:cell division GTPase FtsZ
VGSGAGSKAVKPSYSKGLKKAQGWQVLRCAEALSSVGLVAVSLSMGSDIPESFGDLGTIMAPVSLKEMDKVISGGCGAPEVGVSSLSPVLGYLGLGCLDLAEAS